MLALIVVLLAHVVTVLGEEEKKRGYTVCSSGYAATDTS
jgi:hypothetical protein